MDKFLDRRCKSLTYLSDHSSESGDDARSSTRDTRPSSMKKTCPPKRKYDESYLNFGFISTDSDGEPRPQCVICLETLANASMKPSKLARHQETKHRDTVSNLAEFFKHKTEGLKKQTARLKKMYDA